MAMLNVYWGLTAILAATNATPDAAPAKAAVAICVEQVHKAGHPDFDAYYNGATGRVENNATGAVAENYLFRKCMAEQGFPML